MDDQEAPEWNEEMMAPLRQRIMERLHCSEEEATARLRTTWNNMLQNILEENIPPPPQPPVIPEEPGLAPTKKKTIFVDIDDNAVVSDRVPHAPYEFAVAKMEALEYVEMWYFTSEGCKEASLAIPTTAQDTFGILSTDTGIALQPINASKPSKNAKQDVQLSWEQIMTARHTMTTAAHQVGWPQKYTQMFVEFYINLEGLKSEGYNTQPLILYHATVRRQWYAAVKSRGKVFNISIINEKLFLRLENQIRDRTQEEIQRQVAIMTQRDMGRYQEGPKDRGRVMQRDRGVVRHRSSRSRSPADRATNPSFRRRSTENETFPLSVCPICLSRRRHPIRKCQAPVLWNGKQKTRCLRADDGRIVCVDGRTLCSNWNQTIGCKDRSSRHIHECSGCGESSHGAQDCSLAQKTETANAARR